MNKDEATRFIRDIAHNRPREPKVSTVRQLAHAFLQQSGQKNPLPEDVSKAEALIKDSIKEMQYNLEIKVLAGVGWAASPDVEFMFQ